MSHIGKTNYKNSLVNFASSLMKYYGLTPKYSTQPVIDFLLSKKYKHVAVILLDGMGIKVIDDNLGNGSILKTHQIVTLNSVYPPTTVAATTAIQTGVAPIESGWLGWTLYLEEDDPALVLFKNQNAVTKEPFTKYNVEDKIPVSPFYLNLKKAKSYTIFPKAIREDGVETLKDGIDSLIENAKKEESNFTYLYWTDPDYTMHEYGTTSQVTRTCLMDIENQILKLSENIPNDTIIFITADHGMIDVEPIELSKYPLFVECLKKPFSGEGRFAQFYVKNGMNETFEKYFKEYFGDYFRLFTREEFINSKLSGLYTPNDITTVALGDYVAVATDDLYFTNEIKEDDLVFKAHHAGLTKEEMEIPIILLKRKDEKVEEE